MAIAGPDEDVRDAARLEAEKFRNEGWPKSSCFADVRFRGDRIVYGNGTLLAGDRLINVNYNSVSGLDDEAIGELIAESAPGDTLEVDLERRGQVLTISQPCGDLAEYQGTYLQALDFAGRKKWYDCIDALDGRPMDAFYLELKIRCARVSRKADKYPIEQWRSDAFGYVVAVGKYDVESRWRVADALLKARIELPRASYNQYVEEVVSWDDGETWQSVQPDYSAFRRAAEQGVRGRLIDPQSAIIEMPFDFIYGSWTPAFSRTRYVGFMTCGTVNARNRMGGYTGRTSFISVIDEAGFEKFTDMDSATAEYVRPVDASCARLADKLNLAPAVEQEQIAETSSAAAPQSISAELEALATLHASGALSDEEYAAAKARVLSPD